VNLAADFCGLAASFGIRAERVRSVSGYAAQSSRLSSSPNRAWWRWTSTRSADERELYRYFQTSQAELAQARDHPVQGVAAASTSSTVIDKAGRSRRVRSPQPKAMTCSSRQRAVITELRSSRVARSIAATRPRREHWTRPSARPARARPTSRGDVADICRVRDRTGLLDELQQAADRTMS